MNITEANDTQLLLRWIRRDWTEPDKNAVRAAIQRLAGRSSKALGAGLAPRDFPDTYPIPDLSTPDPWQDDDDIPF